MFSAEENIQKIGRRTADMHGLATRYSELLLGFLVHELKPTQWLP